MTKFAHNNSLKHQLDGFETNKDVQKELGIRIRCLEKSDNVKSRKLAIKLSCCTQRKPCESAACPRCFRYVREWSYSELVRLKNESESPDDIRIITVLFYEEMMGDKQLFRYDFDKLKRRLWRQLERSGCTSSVIGYIEFDYHEESSLWLPHLHLMVLGEETSAIKKLRGMYLKQQRKIGASVGRPLLVQNLKSENRQVSYLCKSYCSRIETYLNKDGKRRTKKYRLKSSQLRLSLRVLDQLGLTGRLFLYRARLVGNEIRL